VQLRNIRPFSQYVPGDLVEVPDGSAADPFYWEAVAPPDDPPADDPPPADPPAPEAPDPAPADPPRLPYPAKEM